MPRAARAAQPRLDMQPPLRCVPLAPTAWPRDPASLRDPYPHYTAWREAGPLLWSPHLFGGAWVLTRHADGEAALRDPRLSAQRTGGWVMKDTGSRRELGAFQRLFTRALLFTDAPDHARLRRVMQPLFTPLSLKRLRGLVEAECDALLDACEGQAQVDFMQAFARPLPAQVMNHWLGVPADLADSFAATSDVLAAFLGHPDPDRDVALAAQTALLHMVRGFERMLRAPATSDGTEESTEEGTQGELLRQLAAASEAGTVRGQAELLAQCAMLLFAGHETTRSLLGNAVQALLEEPTRWATLRQRAAADPSRLAPAVRELLRWQCPVQYTGRRVAADFTLHGQPLQRGDLLIVLIGAANRDPAQHERPDELDFDRAPKASLAFGVGPHVCLGSALSQMEGEMALGRLLQRWAAPRLVQAQADWLPNPLYRGLGSLPVQVRCD